VPELFVNRASSAFARLPTLDGWRAIAISFVIFGHAWAWLGFGTDKLARWSHYPGIGVHIARAGSTGVGIFFCISGFLITSQLIQQGFQLKLFYIRRVFRILPPALVYLATVGALGALGFLVIGPRELLASLFLYRNYLDANAWFTGHFWSLSIEEQFYLAWPLVLAVAGIQRSRLLAAVGVTGLAVWRQMHWPLHDFAGFHTDMRLDGILCGSLMALYWKELKPVIQKAPLLIAPVALLGFFAADLWSGELQSSANLIQAVLACLLIASTVAVPGRLTSCILEFPAIVWVGRWSYSIYLWQQLFLRPADTPHGQFPIRLMALLGFAWLSYNFVELPFQATGRRLLLLRRENLLPTRLPALSR
jgi:peptidoglycan/LPS O-acetylase OafA/YrhL